MPVIAVDGPAASGKGSIAKAIAKALGLPHMDTGMLYRAAALSIFRFGGDFASPFEARRACDDILSISPEDEELRSETVGNIASRISAYPGVRQALLDRQMEFAAQDGGAVLDGRDIGTVIVPSADVKLFITASAEERARRRLREIESRGMKASFEDVLNDIQARDRRDRDREDAPLVAAKDAISIDTTEMDLETAVAAALKAVKEKLDLID